MLRLLPLSKEEKMELYKLNLPTGIVNNIIDYAFDKKQKIYVEHVENGDITKKQSNIIWTLKGLVKEKC